MYFFGNMCTCFIADPYFPRFVVTQALSSLTAGEVNTVMVTLFDEFGNLILDEDEIDDVVITLTVRFFFA